MRILLLIINFLFVSQLFGQLALEEETPFDTINSVISATYPEIYKSNYDSINFLNDRYPNRSLIDFANIHENERDSLVGQNILKFGEDFRKTFDSDSIDFPKKRNNLFFTLYFNEDGKLHYLFYNWIKNPDGIDNLDKAFIEFASNYDFSGLPHGKKWSQCAIFTFARKRGGSK